MELMHSMMFMLSVSAVVELLVHIVRPRHMWLRTLASVLALAAIIFCTEAIVILNFSAAAMLLAFFSLYRAFNMFRVMMGRMHQNYLWRVAFRTSLWLLALQYATILLWAAWQHASPALYGLAEFGLGGLFVSAAVSFATVKGHAQRMAAAAGLDITKFENWPSVTVAIPARNETDNLHDCITSVLASQYPKLEILVLDDCSQTARTPEIIRSFAHDGVRFIQGSEPRGAWLAKNQAYDTLAKAASGEFIVFLGVDVRLQASSLRRVVAYALSKRKSMVSIMPHNVLFSHVPTLIQPMRYFWEIGLPRRYTNRPPVLSSFWLIRKKALQDAGGFEAATRMVVPEAYFARRLTKKDGYSFLASGSSLGITSLKDRHEQRQTAVRMAYPSLHRRPEIVALLSLACLIWAAMPAAAFVESVLRGQPVVALLSAATVLTWGLMYASVLKLAYSNVLLPSLACLPAATLAYAGLLHYSMYKYEFSEVLWKGRNVCTPVMHVEPHLPHV